MARKLPKIRQYEGIKQARSMKVDYIPYQKQFRSQIEKMMLSLYQEDPAGLGIDCNKINATILECTRHPEKVKLLTIWYGGELAGYALIVFFWSNEYGGNILCLDEIYIKEAFRSLGIGSRTIGDMPGIFPESTAISLEVTPSNSRAKLFYERLGFTQKENLSMIRIL
ncbi:MAG: GNAT family N-acetyltransferase [Defluviitaleaceae bacterium]|nr:GNAT family N-acetyltransferase [Defluviitaleaceae bacterium]